MSALVLEIPEEITDALRFPAADLQSELRKELALALYQRGALSGGKAAQLAEMTRRQFDELIGQRRIVRHYTEVDLNEDLEYAGNQ